MSEKDDAGVEKKDQQGSEAGAGVETKGHEGSEHDEVDWKAIAEKERKEKENYKTALAQKRQIISKEPEEGDEEDDKPITRKDLSRLIQEQIVPVIASTSEDRLLASKVSDPAKREAVKAILENSIRRTGTSEDAILSDIDKALAIADSHKLRKVNEELKRAAENKPNQAPSAGASSEKDIEVDKLDPKLKAQLEERARQLKVDPAKFVAQYIKNRKTTHTLA